MIICFYGNMRQLKWRTSLHGTSYAWITQLVQTCILINITNPKWNYHNTECSKSGQSRYFLSIKALYSNMECYNMGDPHPLTPQWRRRAPWLR